MFVQGRVDCVCVLSALNAVVCSMQACETVRMHLFTHCTTPARWLATILLSLVLPLGTSCAGLCQVASSYTCFTLPDSQPNTYCRCCTWLYWAVHMSDDDEREASGIATVKTHGFSCQALQSRPRNTSQADPRTSRGWGWCLASHPAFKTRKLSS
jgi:hypothetical protein